MKSDMNSGLTAEQRFEESIFEMAILRLLQKENENVQKSTSQDTENEIHDIAQRHMSAQLCMIEKQTSKYKHRDSVFHVLKKTTIAVVTCLFIINALFSITLAASKTVRMKALEFFTVITTNDVRMGYQAMSQDIDVPADWENQYYPAYIPVGYNVSLYLPDKNYSLIEYSNDQGNMISIEICSTSDSYSINMENATVEAISLHNTTATVISQEYGKTDIFWTTGENFFIVDGNDKELAMQVAEGIVLLETKR